MVRILKPATRPTAPCPHCGLRAEGFVYDGGCQVEGLDGTVQVRGGDPRPYVFGQGMYAEWQPWPEGDLWKLQPCGHEVTHEQIVVILDSMPATP